MEKFFAILHSMRIREVVDLVVIALLIYFALVWLKRAKARFILLGMVVFGFMYHTARTFKLYLTTIFFQAFFAVFLIVIVIIFQDEFRHLFERIALWPTFKKRRHDIYHQNIDIIGNVASNLVRKKIGALIVIKGKDLLDRYLEAGVELDGVLSQTVLESLFNPGSPSHDGAIIIDDDRILRFSAHLPLSNNLKEIGHFGTRHAAAVGLSERTDAFCIVISEDQGTISVARGGILCMLDSSSDLTAALDEYYRAKFPKRKSFYLFNILANHWIEMIVSIILAATLWLTFGLKTETIRRDFPVNIEYRNLSGDRIIMEPKPKEITVTLGGFERSFDLIKLKGLKLSIDMSKANDGRNDLTITRDMLKFPSDLSLVNVNPETITLFVNRIIKVDAPITVSTKGHLPPGIILSGILIEPEKIPVMVSNTLPQEMITVATDVIDMGAITSTVTITPKLILQNGLSFPDNKLPEVKVTVKVDKAGVTDK